MPTPSENLARSLEALRELQQRGLAAIHTSALSRTHRERLTAAGFLLEVMKGWYLPTQPDLPGGESAAWYTSFWAFCGQYLRARLGDEWCLSPDQSLALHVGDRTVPDQLVVRSPRGRNRPTWLLQGTSILDLRLSLPGTEVQREGMNVYDLPGALVASSPGAYEHAPAALKAALGAVDDASSLLRPLLDGGHSTVAGRLAGALERIGRGDVGAEVTQTMRAAGYTVRVQDPFAGTGSAPIPPGQSPYVTRLKLLWEDLREDVLAAFPAAPGLPSEPDAYLERVDEVYVADAYHSLSIEGYRVDHDLIERVRRGDWSPDELERDRQARDALAARGYWQAFQRVRESLGRVLAGENAGEVVREDHRGWYRELFAPAATAGLLPAEVLAGYRHEQVYIAGSRHVPARWEAVPEAMGALFDLLADEPEPAVRVVLGHFMFVYVHPYMDGNGRLARFLMNTMLAAGGYDWVVIPVEQRSRYLAALERASVHRDIGPFAGMLGEMAETPS